MCHDRIIATIRGLSLRTTPTRMTQKSIKALTKLALTIKVVILSLYVSKIVMLIS